MYSVEITVEKDLATGETKVLSTSTLLPKDLSQKGVKVYEDEQKGDWPRMSGCFTRSASQTLHFEETVQG